MNKMLSAVYTGKYSTVHAVKYITVSVLPSWKLSGVGILANKALGPWASGTRALGFISKYSHSTQFPTG